MSEEEALRRIRQAQRDDHILDISAHGGSDFADLYEKQKHVLEEPSIEERQSYDKVLEITPKNVDDMLQAAVDYYRNHETA